MRGGVDKQEVLEARSICVCKVYIQVNNIYIYKYSTIFQVKIHIKQYDQRSRKFDCSSLDIGLLTKSISRNVISEANLARNAHNSLSISALLSLI